jgi:2'-5' RNA ligase
MNAARSENVDETGKRRATPADVARIANAARKNAARTADIAPMADVAPMADIVPMADVARAADAPMTIGVAISIPQPWAEILDAVRASSGDPLAAFIPAHLTLLGPTDIDADRIGEVESRLAAAANAHAPFAVHMHGTGTFRPVTEVVFVAVSTGIGECERLASDVRLGPLMRDLHYPYHPHVTIAHDVPTDALDRVYAELAHFEARFTADHFTLYVHGSDGHWRPLRDFKLTGEKLTVDAARGDGEKGSDGAPPPRAP